MRIFLRKLVAARAADEAKLKARIVALTNVFREAVGVDDNAGSESSIADVFGLMYAALRLAQSYGALPKRLKPLRAVIKVYGLNRAINGPPPSNFERLHLLAERSGVIHIDATNLQEISDEVLAKAPAVVRTDRHGTILLVLTDKALSRAFPLSNRFFKDPEIQAIMRTDKDGRKKVTLSLRTNKKQERVYAFILNAEPDEL
jgi:hypothetical protein